MTKAPRAPAASRLARALRVLQRLQAAGSTVFRSGDFSRLERTALLDNGYLQMVVKGWYIPARPGDRPGDTTPWYASMQQFVAGYCEQRFGTQWHLSPAYSLHVHAGATTLPSQVIVHARRGTNNVLYLPGGCSLVDYRAREAPSDGRVALVDGLRLLTLTAALTRVPESFFATHPTDAQIALSSLSDASALNRELLNGGHAVVGGRLAGALRALGADHLANEITSTLRAAGHAVHESNPFAATRPTVSRGSAPSPYIRRLEIMWAEMRGEVLSRFPSPPAGDVEPEAYLARVDTAYHTDAYHSLSIEGYRVTDALIARVANGAWSPQAHAGDADAKAAMAAHGYWRAYNAVHTSLQHILRGENAGTVVARTHGTWYRELFAPSVDAGLLPAASLAGYRDMPVYIRNAQHVPPPSTAARDMMPTFFALLTHEPNAAVRAVLGHFCFVFIHPYMDGNGRIGRFLMNAMLASGGYPWMVIPVERRDEYIAALDSASALKNIVPFTVFLASCLSEPMPLSRDRV